MALISLLAGLSFFPLSAFADENNVYEHLSTAGFIRYDPEENRGIELAGSGPIVGLCRRVCRGCFGELLVGDPRRPFPPG